MSSSGGSNSMRTPLRTLALSCASARLTALCVNSVSEVLVRRRLRGRARSQQSAHGSIDTFHLMSHAFECFTFRIF